MSGKRNLEGADMATAVVEFREAIQNVQNIAVDGLGDAMVSEVRFDLSTPEGTFENLSVLVKQAAGSDFEADPLEVSAPDVELRVESGCLRGLCRSLLPEPLRE